MKKPKVVIIGAGLSGLSCAHRLQTKGIEATVYEARPRPGGRIFGYRHGEAQDELGGKFIGDGGKALHMRALIAEMGLRVHRHETPMRRTYYHEGRCHPYPPTLHHLPPPSPALLESLQERAKTAAHLGELLDHHLGKEGILRRLFEIRIRNYDGLDSNEVDAADLSTFWTYYCNAFEHHTTFCVETVEGGNCRLIEALTKAIRSPIHYRSPLTQVGKREGRFHLQIGGRSVEADYLILTIPSSIYSDITFEEGALPKERLRPITELGFGTNAKIMIPVKRPDPNASDYCYTEHAVTYFNDDKSLLTLYYGGEAGCFTDVDASFAQELPALKATYPNLSYKGLRCPTADTHLPYIEAEEGIAINWCREPYTKGSYSCYGPGQAALFKVETEAFGEQISAPFAPLGGLFFAGEHTSIAHIATMEGAIESGERAARMVDRALGAR
ncbi:MAG: flavin monoamine oxidase family protein [Parachlamydiales bacterium]